MCLFKDDVINKFVLSFICGSFNDAVSNTDYVALFDTMISKYKANVPLFK